MIQDLNRPTLIPQRLLDKFVEPIVVLEMRRLWRRRVLAIIKSLAMLVGLVVGLTFLYEHGVSPSSLLEILAMVYVFFALITIATQNQQKGKRDRESGFFQMVAMTRLTSTEIVDQRALAVMLPVFAGMAIGMPAAIMLVMLGAASIPQFMGLLALLVLTTLFLGVGSSSAGCHWRTWFTARRIAYMAVVLLMAIDNAMVISTHSAAVDIISAWIYWMATTIVVAVVVASLMDMLKRQRVAKQMRRIIALGFGSVGAIVSLGIAIIPVLRIANAIVWSIAAEALFACCNFMVVIDRTLGQTSIPLVFRPQHFPETAIPLITVVLLAIAIPVVRVSAVHAIERSRRQS